MVNRIYTVIGLLLLIVSPVTVQKHNDVISQVIYEIYKERELEDGCLLEVRRDAIEWCNLPPGYNTTKQDGDTLSFPPHSKCAVRTTDTVVTCQGCYKGSWHKTTCDQGLYVHRTKRGWFIVAAIGLVVVAVAVVVCLIFCDLGGGSGPPTPPYRPPTLTCHPPNSPVYADRGKTTTVVSWDPPTGKDGKGNVLSPKLVSGSNSGSTFPRGYHSISYSITDSRGSKDICSFKFEVKVRVCDPVPWPLNGRKDCPHSEMIWGRSCTSRCNDGYTLKGYSELTCQENGTYDHEFPTCEAKICPVLVDPVNGQYSSCSNHRSYRSTCTAKCNNGYRLSPSLFTVCDKDGNWGRPLPVCEDNSIPVFNNCPANTIVRYADPGTTSTIVTYGPLAVSDNSGENITAVLVQGQRSGSEFESGAHPVQYVATDSAGNNGHCIFSVSVQVLSCGVPDYQDDNMQINCSSGYNLGSECSIGCRLNLPLIGANHSTCNKDNSDPPKTYWDVGTTPYCQTRACMNLTAPTNGALACDKWIGGTFCNMLCNSNFDIPRGFTATQHYICGTSGNWSPSEIVPNCTEKRIPGRMFLPSDLYYYGGDCSANLDTIKLKFLNTLRNSTHWAQACPVPADCTIQNVEVTCGPTTGRKKRSNYVPDLLIGKRETMVMRLTFKIVMDFKLNGETSTAARDIYVDKLTTLSNGIKDDVIKGVYDNVAPGFTARNDSIQFDLEDFDCPEGQVSDYASVSCRGCPTGTMYNSTSGKCTDCSIGTYQDVELSLNCKQCPTGSFTIQEGANSVNLCHETCSAGESSPTGLVPCSRCPIGSYQDSPGSRECTKCPAETTSQAASTSLSNCTAYDVVLKGPGKLLNGEDLPAADDFSLLLWFKKQDSSDFNILLKNNQTESLDIQISGGHVKMTIMGSKIGSGTNLGPQWNHHVITWKQSAKQFSYYIGGSLVHQTILTSVTSTLLTAKSSLEVNVLEDSEITIRSVRLSSGILDDIIIINLSKSCDSTYGNLLLSLSDMKSDNTSNLSIVTPSTCDAIDECRSSPCGQHGTCINQLGRFECKCVDGYSGDVCTIPPDYCLSNGCQNGATCSSLLTEQSFYCTCTPGYTGNLCETEIVNGGWGNFTEWLQCSAICGGGTQSRRRWCDNPAPDDNGGQPCEGSHTQVKACNTDQCPECKVSDIVSAFGSSIKCTGTTSRLNCTMICRPGTVYAEDQLLNYTCTGGVWTPSNQLEPCTHVNPPRGLNLTTKVDFSSVDCAHVVELKSKVEEKVQGDTCAGSTTCNYDVTVGECGGGGEAATTVTIVLSKDLPEGDLDLAGYQVNKTISPQLRAVAEAVVMLEISGQKLQNSTEDFNVTIGSVTYTATSLDVTGQTVCQAGSVGSAGICVLCTAGTYEEGNVCKDCGRGYYQDEEGSTQCKPCPAGWTTEYIRTKNSSKCSDEILSSTNQSVTTTTDTDEPETTTQSVTTTTDTDEPETTTQSVTTTTDTDGPETSGKSEITDSQIVIIALVVVFLCLAVVIIVAVYVYKTRFSRRFSFSFGPGDVYKATGHPEKGGRDVYKATGHPEKGGN